MAYLTDRVRRAEGKPQLYGTQFWHGPDSPARSPTGRDCIGIPGVGGAHWPTGPSADRDADTNPTTAVVARFGPRDWRQQGAQYVIRHTLRDVGADSYLRVRGTSTDEAEPLADGLESPWSDLWFYSNPVFVRVR
ncbi:hypothetical protein [Micromonospora sp. NPDC002575]|uniref:hypothetical protein n=1 Tax=Micromonospora sp. NPDC002575 TaxID=3364222 RepID=UPI003689DED8